MRMKNSIITRTSFFDPLFYTDVLCRNETNHDEDDIDHFKYLSETDEGRPPTMLIPNITMV